jgi:hypothetical protein
VTALTLSAPAVAFAQRPWTVPNRPPASSVVPYDQGYDRGLRAGSEDLRRGDRFRFDDESDYRRADAGYRSQFGSRDRYRDQFRRGFEVGYRDGYTRNRSDATRGRALPGYGVAGRTGDLALDTGFNDGYEAGLKDAQKHDRFDPVSEGRYRSGDHGYKNWYGAKESYKINYREAFRQGYTRGFQEAQRYDTEPRNRWF